MLNLSLKNEMIKFEPAIVELETCEVCEQVAEDFNEVTHIDCDMRKRTLWLCDECFAEEKWR